MASTQSTELTLRTTELADNACRPLQAQTPLDTRLIGAFDVPPYVNSADQSGAVPFLDIARRLGQSTGQPRSSSLPSTRSGTTRRLAASNGRIRWLNPSRRNMPRRHSSPLGLPPRSSREARQRNYA